mmetsp:Transcript_8346/g.19366  ORF Transcript_8346/g.19366 Transcript_8346/m.19366 type:complete len:227 (-) Transcript_8346:21-701(-)
MAKPCFGYTGCCKGRGSPFHRHHTGCDSVDTDLIGSPLQCKCTCHTIQCRLAGGIGTHVFVTAQSMNGTDHDNDTTTIRRHGRTHQSGQQQRSMKVNRQGLVPERHLVIVIIHCYLVDGSCIIDENINAAIISTKLRHHGVYVLGLSKITRDNSQTRPALFLYGFLCCQGTLSPRVIMDPYLSTLLRQSFGNPRTDPTRSTRHQGRLSTNVISKTAFQAQQEHHNA